MDLEKYLRLLEEDTSGKLEGFKQMLLSYNKMYNLTSITDDKGIFYKHFLDSIVGEGFFPGGASVLDVGSGGGFPAIPLKIVRDDLRLTMLEATGKKCNFLRAAVDKLKLNCVQIINARAETAAHDKLLREKFDIVSARAVASLNTLCEYCLPFVKTGGRFIAYKGDALKELEDARNAVRLLGGEIEKTVCYELPENYGGRTLICIKKVCATPLRYPRGNGKERKNPL